MTDQTEQPTAQQTALAKLREPFEPHQISLLPKQMRRDDRERFPCRADSPDFRKASADGRECGGFHARSIHLDYVGHAALTDRLLEADPLWFWEPMARTEQGLPLFDKDGGLWIRLCVAGMSRLGYGDSQGKTGPNATKEAIGDALRNAGMRFGAALDLWHKGDLHDASEAQGRPENAPPAAAARQESPVGQNQAREIAGSAPSAEHAQQALAYAQHAHGADSSEAVMAVYQQARRAGVLGVQIQVPGSEQPVMLREFLTGLGQQWKARESAPKAAAAAATGPVSAPGEIRADVVSEGDDEPPWAHAAGYSEDDLV